MVQVRCTVNNCTYWDENNFCGADQIIVVGDNTAHVNDDLMEVAEIGHTPAGRSEETSCKTFKPRGGRS